MAGPQREDECRKDQQQGGGSAGRALVSTAVGCSTTGGGGMAGRAGGAAAILDPGRLDAAAWPSAWAKSVQVRKRFSGFFDNALPSTGSRGPALDWFGPAAAAVS